MIVTDLGAAYAPQTVYSPTRLPYSLPLAPTSPRVPAPSLPTTNPYPSRTYAAQPAPVTPPITTPESSDVMRPTPTYTLPNYAYARPQAAPSPSGAATRWQPQVVATADYAPGYGPGATATEPTVEMPESETPAGSMEASLAAQLPWYKRPLPLVGLTLGGGIAIVGAILLLRK